MEEEIIKKLDELLELLKVNNHLTKKIYESNLTSEAQVKAFIYNCLANILTNNVKL